MHLCLVYLVPQCLQFCYLLGVALPACEQSLMFIALDMTAQFYHGEICRSDLATSDVLASLTARKQFQVQQETWLKFMTKADYDVQAQNVSLMPLLSLHSKLLPSESATTAISEC